MDTVSGRLLGVVNRYRSTVLDPTSSTVVHSNFSGHGENRSNQLLFDSDVWSLTPIEGSVRVVRLWAELLAREEYSGREPPRPLDEASWQDRRRKLERAIEGARVSDSVRRIATDQLYWLRCELDLAQQSGELTDAGVRLRRLINSEPGQWRHFQRLGDVLGQRGMYREAASAFQQAFRIGGPPVKEDARWWSGTGLCLLAAGDEAGYRELCRDMMARTIATRAEFSLVLLTAGSASFGDQAQVDRFLKSVFPEWTEVSSTYEGALILARSGRYAEALETLKAILETGGSQISGLAWDYFELDSGYLAPIMAIAQCRLGHLSEARESLGRAVPKIAPREIEDGRRISWGPPTGDRTWDYELAVKLVSREAQALIDDRLNDFPSDPFTR